MKVLKILGIAVAVLVLTTVLTVFLFVRHFTGENGEANTRAAIDRVWQASVPPELKAQVAANEAAVRETFALVEEAQASYKRRHGRYAEHLRDLELPGEIVNAGLGAGPDWAYRGYLFGPVPLDGALANNWVHRYAICAVPASYRDTGIHTYAMDSEGIVLRKDNWGIAVENTVEFLDGSWEPLSPDAAVATPAR
jgi:hypothetical protein